MENRGRYNWGGAVDRVVGAAVDETVADDAGLRVIRGGEVDQADNTVVLPRSAGWRGSGGAGSGDSGDGSDDQRTREAAMQARIVAALRERAALHSTIGYQRERKQSARAMARAQKVYGKKWYITREQLVVAGAAWVGTALVVGSAVGGFWIWFIEATGVCG